MSFLLDEIEKDFAIRAKEEIEEKISIISEILPDALIQINHRAKIIFGNSAAERLFGYTKNKLLGKKFYTFIVNSDQNKLFEKQLLKYLKNGKGYGIEGLKELDILHEQESIIPVEISISSFKVGKKWNAIVLVRDISKRKIDEQKLINSERKYRKILESIKEGYIEVDLEGNFTFFNDAFCEISGYSRKELMNMNFSLLCDKETWKYLFNEVSEMSKSLNCFKLLEYTLLKKDKSKLELESSVYIRKDEKDYIIGFKGIVRDITERKKTDQLRRKFNQKLEEEVSIRTNELAEALKKQKLYLDQILKASHFKSEFLATMSHELRTPLNAIIGFADLLLEGVYGFLNEEQMDFIVDIKHSAEHQFEMISKILDISKIESGDVSLSKEYIEIKPLVEQVVSTLRPMLNSKNLSIKLKGFKENSKILADRIKFKQILYNLLSNAVKFTEKGTITLEFNEQRNFWDFKVSDTGIGIKEEDFDLIFKDFKRVKSNFVRNTPGAGLGLSLTKRMVELHGGTIDFESTYQKGSCFMVSLPKNSSLDDLKNKIHQFLGVL